MIRVDGFILTPPRAYPYPFNTSPFAVVSIVSIVSMLDLAFAHAVQWPRMN